MLDGFGNRMGGYRRRLGGLPGMGMATAIGPQIFAFMFFSFIGRALIMLTVAWLGWMWLTGTLTEKEANAWQAEVYEKQLQMDSTVDQLEAETRQKQALAKGRMTRAEAIYKLVERGIRQVEPPDPVEAATVDLINETRGNVNDDTPIN